MRMELEYFVFTSGEKGVHGFDWGVKFSSYSLKNPHELDEHYRKTLSEFNLSPSLERPENFGLLLIPFDDENLLGFIFPGHDLKGRPNTITVACKIPDEISKRFNVNEVVKNLWASNDLAKISQHENNRPNTILFNENFSASNEFQYLNLITWPNINNGYIVIDEKIKKLQREIFCPINQPQKIKLSKQKYFFAACLLIAGIMIFYGVSKIPSSITPPLHDIQHLPLTGEARSIDKLAPPEKGERAVTRRGGTKLQIPDGCGFIDEKSFNEILKSLYVKREIGKFQFMEKMLILPTNKNEADFKSDLTKIFRTENSNSPLFNKNFFVKEILKHIKFDANDAVIYFWDNVKENNHDDLDFYIKKFIEQALKNIRSEKGVFYQR